MTNPNTTEKDITMCDSIAEGGRRCTGQHLTVEQHAERADRRRAADRERKAAKKSAGTITFPTCEFPRPSDIPGGHLHQSQLAGLGIKAKFARDYALRTGVGTRTEEPIAAGVSRLWFSPEEAAGFLDSPEYAEAVGHAGERAAAIAQERDWAELDGRRSAETPGTLTPDELLQRGWTRHYIDKLLGQGDRSSRTVGRGLTITHAAYKRWLVEDAERDDPGLRKKLARDAENRRLDAERKKADKEAAEKAKLAAHLAEIEAEKAAQAARGDERRRAAEDYMRQWTETAADAPLDDTTPIDPEQWAQAGSKARAFRPPGYFDAVKALPDDERAALVRTATERWVPRQFGELPTETRTFVEDKVNARLMEAPGPNVLYEMLHAPASTKSVLTSPMRWVSQGARPAVPSPHDVIAGLRYKHPLKGRARFIMLSGNAWGVIAPEGTAENTAVTVTKASGEETQRHVGEAIPLGEINGERAVLFL